MLPGFKREGSTAEKSTLQKSNQGVCIPHVRDVEISSVLDATFCSNLIRFFGRQKEYKRMICF